MKWNNYGFIIFALNLALNYLYDITYMTEINMKNILFFIALYCIAAATNSYAAEKMSAEDPRLSVLTTSGVQLISKSGEVQSNDKSSKNLFSKLTLKHTTSNSAQSGPDCIKSHEAKIMICIRNSSYKFDAITVADHGRIGSGNVVVSNKNKKCRQLVSQIKKDHSGKHPNYKCSEVNPLVVFEVNIKYTN